jgi:hypothetical protein
MKKILALFIISFSAQATDYSQWQWVEVENEGGIKNGNGYYDKGSTCGVDSNAKVIHVN